MKKGFTLIELLVVVLIAGILVSVALPQYRRAVEKSIAMEAVTTARAIIESQNRSLDAYPNDHVNTQRALDIILDNGTWSGDNDNTYTTQHFVYTLTDEGVSVTTKVEEGHEDDLDYRYTFTFNNTNHPNVRDNCHDIRGHFCSTMAGFGFTGD